MPAPQRNRFQQVLDGLNKGLVADTFGAPVDLATMAINGPIHGINYLGKKAGLLDNPIRTIDKPFGGSEQISDLMARAGLVSKDEDATLLEDAVRFGSGMVGPAGVFKAPQAAAATGRAVKSGAQALGQKGADMAEDYLVKQGLAKPIVSWHGSPKKFDSFDVNQPSSTGHAYTKGAYTAAARREAEGYTGRDPAYEEKLMSLYNQASQRRDYTSMEVLEQAMLHSRPKALREQFLSPDYSPEFQRTAERVIGQVDRIPTQSSLYKVDVADEALPNFLRWDEPLSDNPAAVQAMGRKLGLEGNDYLGGDVIGRLRSNSMGERKLRTELQNNGVPGVVYNSTEVPGSVNYVTYDPKLLKILEINDKPFRGLLD